MLFSDVTEKKSDEIPVFSLPEGKHAAELGKEIPFFGHHGFCLFVSCPHF